MKIGVVGLGKLGLPVALGIEARGHQVFGYEINPAVAGYLTTRKVPYKEKGLQSLLNNTQITFKSLKKVIELSDIIFIAVQTPHDEQYEGTIRLTDERADFDYNYLKKAITDIANICSKLGKHTNIVVISTCLPGTFDKEIKPLLNSFVHYVYNPFFIAMGTVLDDFYNPEFVLIGAVDRHNLAHRRLMDFYATVHNRPCLVTDVITAEAIKVSYNTFITMKTVLGNAWGEMAHKMGFDIDDVYRAWSMSTDRLISSKYLRSGVGDGGGCHPRDNIALSYLSTQIGMSHNIWDDFMKAREDHMDWLAQEAVKLSKKFKLPLIILGRSFKPETDIETGSPAILMTNIIKEYGFPAQNYENLEILPMAVYVIATQHEKYKHYLYHKHSIILDPFGYMPDKLDVDVIRIGRNAKMRL